MVYDLTKGHKITGKYGEVRPYYKNGHTHGGIDIAYAENSPMLSAINGQVVHIGNDPSGYGNYIDIFDANSGIKTRLGHANSFNVKKGDLIKAGQQIGLVGKTGRATGPHIHFEVFKNNIRTNPMTLNNLLAMQLQPKGSVAPIDTNDLFKQYAALFAQKDNENKSSIELTPEEQKLRGDIVQLVSEKLMNPVEMPKQTTIQDIFSAKKGDKLGVFAQMLNDNPEAQRTIGSFLGGTTMDQNGNFVHGGEDLARRTEAKYQADREKALEEEKMQNQLAGNVYGEMAGIDQAKALNEYKNNALDQNLMLNLMKQKADEAEAQKEAEQKQFTNDLEVQKLGEQNRHNKVMEDIARQNAEDKGKKADDDYKDIEKQLNNFENMFDKVPNKVRGMTEGLIRRKLGLASNNEAYFDAQRTLLFNTIARRLSGEKGVLSNQDIERIDKALPTLSDSFEQRKSKMKAVYDLLEIKKGNSAKSNPLGLSL